MRIHRSRPASHFTQIPDDTLRDERLSYAARGILCELLSRPDGWETTADQTVERARRERGAAGEGRRPVRAAFAELKAAGYMIAERVSLPGGKWGFEVHVFDRPHTGVPPAGTSVPPAHMQVSAGGTEMPPAGTSVRPVETGTDVPHGGTSVRPAETGVYPVRTDVPLTDVPHAGTSLRTQRKNRRPKNNAGENAGEPPREDVDRICAHLVDRIAANGSKRPKITASWRTEARLLLDRDGRTEQQVHAAIEWCQGHRFWRSKVMSMPKLREKYDVLRLDAEAERDKLNGQGRGGRPAPASGGAGVADHRREWERNRS